MSFSILEGNCLDLIPFIEEKVDLTFLDPPFNQNKEYKYFNDNLSEKEYWDFIYNAVEKIFNKTSVVVQSILCRERKIPNRF